MHTCLFVCVPAYMYACTLCDHALENHAQRGTRNRREKINCTP